MELSEIAGLDEEKGITFCGSREGWIAILTSFVKELPAYLRELQDYHDRREWDSYSRRVHGMKSSFRAIGIEELADMALELEKFSDSRDLEAVDSDHGTFIEKCGYYAGAISPIILGDAPATGQGEAASSDKIEDAYRSISEFLSFRDYDSIEMVLSSMEGFELPSEDRERFDKLSTALRRLDRKAMEALLEGTL